jgi:hypothetical protein
MAWPPLVEEREAGHDRLDHGKEHEHWNGA